MASAASLSPARTPAEPHPKASLIVRLETADFYVLFNAPREVVAKSASLILQSSLPRSPNGQHNAPSLRSDLIFR